MSVVVVGGMVTVGALAAMYLCGGGQPKEAVAEMEQVQSGAVANVTDTSDLKALFAKGGKAVVYLSAVW